jgi:hypothetical protein
MRSSCTVGLSFAKGSVAASWDADLGSEEAIKIQNILHKHRDDIFQQRADISCLGSFGAEMEDLIFRWRMKGKGSER